ncbi:FGGY-family carbohydrate kinase [Gordonia humi]|uniref:Xylulokinase n=2 Tax=Gordonia humi TaxID=686429 RepID=A0A840F135_9ACTN|nr:FGGY-family carbohydrate kinase [Gordonia humi]MBB4134060.1 xylulokinase [Gordonia humi]
MTLRVVIGIDKGTSTLKTAAIDVASGRFVAEAGARTPSSFPHPGFHEEDADGTWSAVASTIRTVVGALPEEAAIVAVGVTGHMGGVWAIDENGEPVRPAICWPDSRAVSILDRVVEADDGRMFAIGGNAIVPGTPYPLLAWIKEHEPENYRRISTFFMAKDYVNYRLTGVIATEESDLSFAPCDFAGRCRSDELFAMFGLDDAVEKLPRIGRSIDLLGYVTESAAAETGLPAGTPVGAGTGDATANMLGTGATADGQAVTTLGTSLMNGTSTDHPIFEPEGVGFGFLMPNSRWQRQISNSGGGTLCLDWVVETFCPEIVERIAADETTLGAVVDAAIANTEPGACGLLFHPYLNTAGATAPFVDVNARGSLVGLTPEMTCDHMIRAVLEGTAMSIRHCYEAMPVPIDTIRLTGGGARSRVWAQIISDVLQKTIIVPDVSESGALGAALLAAVAAGEFPDLDTAADHTIPIGRVHEPNPANADLYDRVFAEYRDTLPALRRLWPSLARARTTVPV